MGQLVGTPGALIHAGAATLLDSGVTPGVASGSASVHAHPVVRSGGGSGPVSASGSARVIARTLVTAGGVNVASGYIVTANGTSGGSGTNASPWSLQHALNGAGGVIQPGHVVYLRSTGGPYLANSSGEGWSANVSGTLASPITFEGYPGDNVVIDGSIRAFVDTPTTAWEPVSISSGRNIYRSTATFTFGEYNGFIQIAGEWFTLPSTLQGKAYIESTLHTWDSTTVQPTPYYLGPSFAWDSASGRIYIRLDPSTSAAQLGRAVPAITDPDPRNHQIHIGTHDRYAFRVNGSHLIFKNLPNIHNFYGAFGCGLGGAGQWNVKLINCGGRTHYFGVRGGNCGSGGSPGLLMDGCKFYAHTPSDRWWVAWMDIKAWNTVAGTSRKCAVFWDNAVDSRATNCEFHEFFDGMLSDAGGHDIEVDHCLFQHTIDDGWQMNAGLYRINIHHNTFIGAGPSHNAPGAGTPNADPGTVYIHHNIIDTSKRLVFWGRQGSIDEGIMESIPISLHGEASGYASPWKIYHNTIVKGLVQNSKIVWVGWDYFGGVNAANHQAAHEVYNNVFAIPNGTPGGRDFRTNRASPGHEIYDGNVYWHYRTGSQSGYKSPWGAFLHTSAGTVDPQALALSTVAQLRAHGSVLADTQVYYAPGWEASGLSVDPQLDANYRPANTAVHTGAVNITAKPWPDTTVYEAHRGAVAP